MTSTKVKPFISFISILLALFLFSDEAECLNLNIFTSFKLQLFYLDYHFLYIFAIYLNLLHFLKNILL